MTSLKQGNLLLSISQYKSFTQQNINIKNISVTMPCHESLSKGLLKIGGSERLLLLGVIGNP